MSTGSCLHCGDELFPEETSNGFVYCAYCIKAGRGKAPMMETSLHECHLCYGPTLDSGNCPNDPKTQGQKEPQAPKAAEAWVRAHPDWDHKWSGEAFAAGAKWAVEQMVATVAATDLQPDFKEEFAEWLKGKVGMNGEAKNG